MLLGSVLLLVQTDNPGYVFSFPGCVLLFPGCVQGLYFTLCHCYATLHIVLWYGIQCNDSSTSSTASTVTPAQSDTPPPPSFPVCNINPSVVDYTSALSF